MKNKTQFLSIVILLSVAVILTSCQKQKVVWKGQMKTEDGVIVVENPKTPMYEQPVLILDEDLRIGEE